MSVRIYNQGVFLSQGYSDFFLIIIIISFLCLFCLLLFAYASVYTLNISNLNCFLFLLKQVERYNLFPLYTKHPLNHPALWDHATHLWMSTGLSFNVYSSTQSVWGLFFCPCSLCNTVPGMNKNTSLANLSNESVIMASSVLIPCGWRFKRLQCVFTPPPSFCFFYHSCNLFLVSEILPSLLYAG